MELLVRFMELEVPLMEPPGSHASVVGSVTSVAFAKGELAFAVIELPGCESEVVDLEVALAFPEVALDDFKCASVENPCAVDDHEGELAFRESALEAKARTFPRHFPETRKKARRALISGRRARRERSEAPLPRRRARVPSRRAP